MCITQCFVLVKQNMAIHDPNKENETHRRGRREEMQRPRETQQNNKQMGSLPFEGLF